MDDLLKVNVPHELEEMGWDFEFVGENEIKCRCPAHDDKSASASLNIEKRMWHCHTGACNASGDFFTFVALATKKSRADIYAFFADKYKFESVKTIDIALVERYHTALWDIDAMKKELYDRGLIDDDIRKYRLGYCKNRITIPVPNEHGNIVNLRRYQPGAPGDKKMLNTRGHGKMRLFPVDQLSFDDIILVGGECKAIVTARHMNEYGLGAITATAGEGNWEPYMSEPFKGKRVYICYDIDESGWVASERIGAQLKHVASEVRMIRLPLDPDKYPAGDPNDYFGPEKKTGADLFKIIQAAEEWVPKTIETHTDDSPAQEVTLGDATAARHTGRRIKLNGVVAAIDSTPYIVPKTVTCACERNQSFCSICPVFAQTGDVELTINRESPSLIEMVNSSEKNHRDAIRKGLGVPPCKTVKFTTTAHYNIEDIRVVPQLDITTTSTEERMLPALAVSHGLQGSTPYVFQGRTFPHPRSSQAILLASDTEPAEDSLSTFKMSPDDIEALARFKPQAWTMDALRSTLDDVYNDLEANVTRIYGRRDMHLAIDLVYHSPLLVPFDGRVNKGWVEVLIVGDSAQGKSESSMHMMKHYGLGEKVDAKNASVAGLLGGMQQLGSRWFVTWGKFPLADRRMIILEELKGAHPEVIGKLTDMRSSGVAEIDKIGGQRRTHARTRLLAISNPRSDGPLSSYNFGVESILELIGGPEDVRRFDMVYLASATQIPASEMNRLAMHRPKVNQVYTADLCRKLVLWAWTREPEHIVFAKETTQAILDASTKLCETFTDAIPIVDRGSMRLKMARLCASLACRTFSTDDGVNLVVRPCHVEYIADLLTKVYSTDTFGYRDFTTAYNNARQLRDPDTIQARVLATPFPSDFIEEMLHASNIELRDICDWCGWERGEATDLLSLLVRKRALYRDGRSYRKNPEFIKLLKTTQLSDALKRADRPDHVKEMF